MESIFENRYVMTKAMLREFHWKIGHYVLLCILAGVAILMCFIAAALGGWKDFYLLIWAVVFTAINAVMFFITANQSYKRIAEQASGEPFEVIFSFYDEGFMNAIIDSKTRAELDYATIKKVIVTRNLIVLKTRAQVGYMLRRDSFTKGTEEAFMRFINEKIAANKAK